MYACMYIFILVWSAIGLRLAGLGYLLPAVSADTAGQEAAQIGWKVEGWGPCDDPCGSQTRTVLCWDLKADVLVDKTPCPTSYEKPTTTQDCPGCECSDPSTHRTCSCNGHIPEGLDQCQCDVSFTGDACETMVCPASWTAEDCECCPSGVVSQSGACCNTGKGPPSLDMDGECCYGHLDGCGICDGKGMMRASNGECCQEGQDVDGSGNCCPEGQLVDACGVCDGLNNTCGTTIRLLLVVDPAVDADVKATVQAFVMNQLRYPLSLVRVSEIEALDVTEVVPFAGILEGGSDTSAFSDDSNDFVFGRVTVELEKLGSVAGAATALVDLGKMTDALNSTSQEEYAGVERIFLVSVMRSCGDGICSPGEHPSDTDFTGPSIYGNVTYNPNGTYTGMMANDASMGVSNGMNSTTGSFNGTFERTNPTMPPTCSADCKTACPALPPPGNATALPVVCSGRGTCDSAAGMCQCYAGFDGPDCGMCAKGYMLTYGGFCVQHPDQGMCGVPGTPGKSPDPPPDTSKNSTTPDPPNTEPRGENQKRFSDWTDCTKACDGGTQTRTWECVDANGKVVDPDECDPPSDKDLSQECNLIPCEKFNFVMSSWSPCSQSCGGGYKTRKLTCFSTYGHAVENSKCSCDAGMDCSTFDVCNSQACDGPYLTFSTYSACSVVCGGGTKTRTASCNHPNGTTASPSVCLEADLQDDLQEVQCNTAKCKEDSFIWRTGEWSACSPAICGGTRTREVTCRNAYTGALASTGTACAGMKPDEEQSCEPCGFCEDPLLNENCSDNGECINDVCVCDPSTTWGGAICDVDTALCAPPGRLDPDGNCCASGLLSSTGECCEEGETGSAPVLDGDGECCSAGFFDACGVCGAANIGIDLFGICCPAGGIFDTQARCCASGQMDACGVCDGTGDSCKTNVVVETATASRRRQLLQTSSSVLQSFFASLLSYPQALVTAIGTLKPGDAATTVADVTLEPTSGTATAANAITSTEDITVAMELARNDPSSAISIVSSPVVAKIPECGDDLCSPGEARTQGAPLPQYDCPDDCPIILGTCPSPGSSQLGDPTRECGALGSCARASLSCVCFAGYDGEACGYCAEGFRQVGNSCEVILALIESPPPATPVAPVDPPAEPEIDPDAGPNVGLIAGLTILCVAITGAAAGAGYAYRTGLIGQRRRPEDIGVEFDSSLA